MIRLYNENNLQSPFSNIAWSVQAKSANDLILLYERGVIMKEILTVLAICI